MTKTYELRRKVTGAMLYPAIILAVIAIIGVLMMVFMVPTLTATFKDLGIKLPLTTRLVIGLSDFLKNNFILFILAMIASLFSLLAWSHTNRGGRFWDWLTLRTPVLGSLVRQYNSAVIMRTISSLISSGVSMTSTMEITERVVQNHYFKRVIESSIDRIQKGISLSVIFSEEGKLFPVLVPELAEVGEETGNLSEMLGRGAFFYEGEIDQATKNLSTIIEPILMVIIGVAVGLFVYAMIGPMYSLTSAIK